jgi:hypothetical protein
MQYIHWWALTLQKWLNDDGKVVRSAEFAGEVISSLVYAFDELSKLG